MLNWTATNDYKEKISHDPNGNILSYDRNGIGSKLDMDKLAYNYYPNTNRLNYVADAVSSANYSTDMVMPQKCCFFV